MPDIFLSYNREDQPTARLYAEALEAEGFAVWWDVTLRSGDAYDEVTEAALRGAKAVIVLWSRRSVVSRWVRAEATVADRNKTLVPVMIEPCERPIMFELTQTAELGHWQGDRSDSAWRAFVSDVRRFIAVRSDGEVASSAQPLTVQPTIPRPDKKGEAPSMAVLPFTNRSGLAEDDVFALGMVEDLIDALSQGVNLRVLASSATARFRAGELADIAVMARELGVRYVMEGNVRRTGDQLRVTAQLVEAADSTILWTQKFERPLSELAALQEDLVLDVAAQLGTRVHRIEMERLLRKPDDLTAWECVTRAIAAYRQINPESMVQALAEARRATEIAPDYALAHAMLADAMAVIYMWTSPDDAAAVAAIRAHIDRALLLDHGSAVVLAHVAQAFNYIGAPAEGPYPAQRSIELSPAFGLGHYAAGVACLLLNRNDEALAHFDHEEKAAAGWHTLFASYVWRGAAHLRKGDWEQAAHAYERATLINPNATSGYFGNAFVAAHHGESEEARALMAKVRSLEPGIGLANWERLMRRVLANHPVRDEVIALVRNLWENAAVHNAPVDTVVHQP